MTATLQRPSTETSNWYSESPNTQSFVANPGRGCSSDMQDYLREAGDVFAVASHHYFASNSGVHLSTEGLDMTRASGWLGFAGRLATGYIHEHYNLISSNAEYRQRIGGIMDVHDLLWRRRKPKQQSDRSRDKRYLQEGHKMIKDAITEGVYTAMAVYPVVPAVVQRENPDLAPDHQIALSLQALPSAISLSQKLGRHSKTGNEQFLATAVGPRLQRPSRTREYKRLIFNPARFVFDSSSDVPVLHLNQLAHNDGDTFKYFTGCPAIAGGSIIQLNKRIAQLIRDEACYIRALQPKITQ